MESQCIRDEDGRLLGDKDLIAQRWARFFHSLLNAKAEKLDPDITSKLQQRTFKDNLEFRGRNQLRERDSTGAPSDGEFQTNGNGRTSC